MIWIILTLSPVVLAIIWGLYANPGLVFFVVGWMTVIIGWVLLFSYGGWEMGWFTHCGTFWESAHCGG